MHDLNVIIAREKNPTAYLVGGKMNCGNQKPKESRKTPPTPAPLKNK